jgi:formylglycine-generating enzyme required for sulfatase activity/tRNA A-37 threonylcarbamoyl transferase component Bud32
LVADGSLLVSSAYLSVGAVFGRDFRIVRPLREGGMGAVYVAEQLSTGKLRALKVMAPELATDPATRERFVFEARAASRIESDHVVEIVTAGVDEETGSPYLVMELLKGEDLGDAIGRSGALPLGDVAEVLSQVGHALAQAHAQGVVHRDLKPENVFLAASRRTRAAFTAKVLDFGIAKLVADAQKTGTQPLGTPNFMAPEQTDRRGRISPATDVWALGLIAFKLLTGRDFWRESDGSLPMLLREVVVDEIPFASARVSEHGLDPSLLPPGFDAWFARCVHRDVDARFADAGDAVRAFLELVPPDAPAGKLAPTTPPGLATDMSASFRPSISAEERASWVNPTRPADAHAATVLGAPASAFPTASPSSVTTSGPASAAPSKSRAWIAIALGVATVAGGGAAVFLRPKGAPEVPPASLAAAASAAPSSAAAAGLSCPAGMALVSGGAMIMGAKDGSEDAKITHKVTLSSYCLDVTEVTTEAYEACVQAGQCEKAPQDVSYPGVTEEARKRLAPLCNARRAGREKHPINCVDWRMASGYCDYRKARLPTEAEWEFAARGSGQRTYPWGDEAPDEKRLNACGAECVAWSKAGGQEVQSMFPGDDGYAATAPVGSFPAGASTGHFLDLAGNVWEWTADWYAPYAEEAATDPKGPATGTERVVRGGAFNGWMLDWAKPAYRWKSVPTTYNHAIGFRCAASPKG